MPSSSPNRVRLHTLAKELDVPSRELLNVAQALGIDVHSHANTLDRRDADSLKAALQGMAYASKLRQMPGSGEAPAAEPTDNAGEGPGISEIGPQGLMMVSMAQHDVRVSRDYDRGFNNMLKVIAALLADPRQTARTENDTVPWGDLYFLRADQSTPAKGQIELEYGETSELRFSQRQKGILGDIWWSATWFNEDWTRPFEKLLMAAGARRDPEADFRNQLESDLRALQAQGLLTGLEEWSLDTGWFGRNIYLKPQPPSAEA